MHNHYSEQELLALINHFEAIVENLIRKYKNSINLEAEDIRQEACLKIMLVLDEKKRTMNDEIYPFINTCLKNMIMDLIRESARQDPGILYDDMRFIVGIHHNVRPTLKDLLYGLDKEEMYIACMYIDGLYQDEIGKILGLSQQTISNRLKVIRTKITNNI
jgi:RNA polymerase sigma factor (sigma-70 family)